jgi:hypothetical protein
MEYAMVIIGTVVFALAIGWLRGRKQIDPQTSEGRAYYR